MATLTGITWSPVVRIPLDGVQSGQDHFLPSIAVDRTSSGATARVTVSYYHYPVAGCGFATCKLDVAATSSSDGGATWSAPVFLAGPMSLSWVPDTTQGRMVGDYFSTSYVGGHAQTFLAVARDPLGSGKAFDQVLSTAALAAPAQLAASRPVDARVAADARISKAHPITAR
jgi:hypothetical protein